MIAFGQETAKGPSKVSASQLPFDLRIGVGYTFLNPGKAILYRSWSQGGSFKGNFLL